MRDRLDEITAHIGVFSAYSIGLVYASICTSLEIDDALRRMNLEYPAGRNLRWELAPNQTFATGQTNGCVCDINPRTHKHYLLNC